MVIKNGNGSVIKKTNSGDNRELLHFYINLK